MEKDHEIISALASSCWRVTKSGELMAEDLLSRLVDHEPAIAYICVSLLRTLGSDVGKALGEYVHQAVPVMDNAFVSDSSQSVVLLESINVDVQIIAVKPVELRACLRAFDVPNDTPPTVFGSSGLCGWLVYRDGLQFAISMVGTAGNIETAVLIAALGNVVKSRCSVLVGMAAGVEDEVDLGDVIVAEAVVDYEYFRSTSDGPIYQPRMYHVAERRIRHAETLSLRAPEWVNEAKLRVGVRSDSEAGFADIESMTAYVPTVRRGVVLAGSRLIEDGKLKQLANDVHGRARVAEMEGAGFAAACDELRLPWYVVRGVADFGEPERRKGWQFPASVAAAYFVRSAFRSGIFSDPRESADPNGKELEFPEADKHRTKRPQL